MTLSRNTFLVQHFHPEAPSLNYYVNHMLGYTAFKKALTHPRDHLIQAVKESNLHGRGGAGFSTGMKWSFFKSENKQQTYLVCNADESEPGTFKDRKILRYTPHLLLEGCLIAAYAIGASIGYIYIRGEYSQEFKILKTAIDEAYAHGVLGQNLEGSSFSFDLTLHRGGGAYICGEETALLNSIEGKRGEPRVKPPFPTQSGLWDCPTLINNVETLAMIPFISKYGGQWFKNLGTSKQTDGLRLFCVSGQVKKPGVYEFSSGEITLKHLIEQECGGILGDKKLKAVIPGGTSTSVLSADEIDIPLDIESFASKKTSLGSAGIIVISEDYCIVRLLTRITRFYAHESCGQCTPCREGCQWMYDILKRIESGKGHPQDLTLLMQIANQIHGKTLCALGEAAANPVISFLQKFPADFEAHIRGGKCQSA